eukprot:TRINITY_DN4144_c1_g3_i1.p1 TRINITY_DN4144_c1_g3~~TRINITY_DN4144_c1_g3_i1.p1  ORF type:complete len:393 (-),score=100.01 TRINITY_DN4144_c1_g3_i1:141-1190(-)
MKRQSSAAQPTRKRQRVVVEYETTPPEHWKEVYDGISVMRAENPAAVDTMGCATQWDKNADAKTTRYQTLVNLMLSSQTKDEVNAEAMKKLIAHGLTPENIVKTSDEDLDKLIYSVGFHNRKVKYIKAASQILLDKYDGDIPPTLEGLCDLPGVGKKMGFLTMTHAWDKPIGIGVDVHVQRIANRLGWVKTETPETTRLALEAWLPQEYWGKEGVNKLLVGFGQTICKPLRPNCAVCKVNHLCPSAFADDKKREKEKEMKREKTQETKRGKGKQKEMKEEKEGKEEMKREKTQETKRGKTKQMKEEKEETKREKIPSTTRKTRLQIKQEKEKENEVKEEIKEEIKEEDL